MSPEPLRSPSPTRVTGEDLTRSWLGRLVPSQLLMEIVLSCTPRGQMGPAHQLRRATVDEVETDVVEIEAKLDKTAHRQAAQGEGVLQSLTHPSGQTVPFSVLRVGDSGSLETRDSDYPVLWALARHFCSWAKGVWGGKGAHRSKWPSAEQPLHTAVPARWLQADRRPPCPHCRATVDEVETDVVEIEAKLDKLVKLCSGMIEAGKAYVTTNRLFVSGVRDLSQQCQGDSVISECLQRFGDSLQEMVNYHMILFDQAQRSVRQQLHNFVKEDVRKFKETKKQFDKVREDLELSLARNAQAPRHRPHEVEEATGALTVTRKCFRHLALDYVLQINVLQAKKKFEILDSMLSFMHAQYSFFQQGYSLLHQLDPYMKKLAAELDQLVIDSAVEKREMEHRHAAIQQRTLLQDFSYDEPKAEFDVDAPSGVVMEGYLFKRASNAFKTWNRRWFSIQNSQLVYQKKLKDVLTVVVDDLRLCSVKPCEDIERRFCFEVVSPTKSCMLQADSEKLRQAWVHAVQASIASAYRESPDSCYGERLDRTASPSTSSIDSATDFRERGAKGESALQRMQSVAGNGQCGDCGQPDPRWASINLGVLLCIECSGIHRSLGVHCSKVRSLTLDSWEPELLKLMCELGNSTMNQIYEAQCEGPGSRKPTASSPRQDKEAWIKDKYVEKKFLRKPPLAPAREAPRRWRRAWIARTRPNSSPPPLSQVCLFLKRGADQHALDQEQQDPLSIAIQEANADIVTLLRLARMAEEMREAEAPPGQPGPLAGSSPTELQYRRCIQEFISLHLEES
ncbi:arf-GAP with coiled-coil, ANK repeat and PH domain-containing protein 3 [Pteropus vampyrus]|uniref:Arf-GAP with coiled-coil, ANK repeat and PH domain-containing protein n=1 Tax=Pteropus vampyrus TaxID=132908 RepID=A0A6P6BQS3_PTEVA|nr:arf-GAP with coiled-coil, ANK repeat and PH domain-containing protein 3 [Pteropus vampyrus]